MDNQNVKRGRGRPPKYSTEEERKDAMRKNKTAYMLEKEWYCNICNTGINYTLAGKHCHMKTKKHIKNNTSYIGWYSFIENKIKDNANDI